VKDENEDKAILVSLPPHITILRRSCHIVILILYRLSMLSQTCCLKKGLIMTFILILLWDWQERYNNRKGGNGGRIKNRSKCRNPHVGKTYNYRG